MFWKDKFMCNVPENVVEKEYEVLEEVLDDENILQECKAHNGHLIDFLVQPVVMEKLVNLITNEPDEQAVIEIRYKHPNIACEILTFDIDAITEALISQETLLNKLYSFLETEMPLNPLLSSFFSKTMCLLLSKKSDQLFEFLTYKGNFLDLMLRHIEISAIMNLLLKFLTFSMNDEIKSDVLKWLNDQSIAQRLVSLMNPALSKDVHDNVTQLLCDLIRASREHMSMLQENADPNPLLETIESTEVISSLVNCIFGESKNESVIVNGISVLLTLLEFKKYGPINSPHLFAAFHLPSHNFPSHNALRTLVSISSCPDGSEQMTALDVERLSFGINNTLEAIIPHLNDIHKTLLNPPLKPSITLTTGYLDPPLGQSRLEIARLITGLISSNTHVINVQLASLGTIVVFLDLFFKYKWNNFLHTQVEIMIKRIITNSPTVDDDDSKVHPLLTQLFEDWKITKKILESFCGQELEHSEGSKNGYMGHLTKIANHIVHALENGVNSLAIENSIKNLSENHYNSWTKFVNNTLADINAKNVTPLVVDVNSSNSSDHFGFMDRLVEADETLSNRINLTGQVTFPAEDNIFHRHTNLDDTIFQRNAELFEQVCHEKCEMSITEDVDSDEDVWVKDEKELSFIEPDPHTNSSDSDNEEEDGSNISLDIERNDKKMDIEQDHWSTNFDTSIPMEITPLSTSNPWEATDKELNSATGKQENWADFSDFSKNSPTTSSVECSPDISPTTIVVSMDTSDPVLSSKFLLGSENNSNSNTGVITFGDVSIPLAASPSIENIPSVVLNEDLASTGTNDECSETISYNSPSTDDSAIEESTQLQENESETLEMKDSLQTEDIATDNSISAIVQNGPL